MGLQSELEDLCFAVMHPREYRALRSELDTIWGLPPLSPTCIADAADKALTAPATPPKSDPADDSPAIPTGSITVSPPAEVALPSSSLQTFASSSGTGVSTPVASSNILSMPGAARKGTSVQEGSAAVAAATTSSELTVGTTECSSTMSSSRGARSPSTVGSVSQVLDSGAATVGAAVIGAAGEPSHLHGQLLHTKLGVCNQAPQIIRSRAKDTLSVYVPCGLMELERLCADVAAAAAALGGMAAEERTGGESTSGKAQHNRTPEQQEVRETFEHKPLAMETCSLF